MVEEVERAIFELGDEGRLLEIQLKELVGDLENEELLIVKDYMSPSKRNYQTNIRGNRKIKSWRFNEIR